VKKLVNCLLFYSLVSCSAGPHHASPPAQDKAGGMYSTTAFAPDGVLWRVSPGRQFVYVDSSKDQGQTFSAPLAVNAEPQKVRANSEDRPDIGVDGQGNIYVVYAADAEQPWTAFYSVSHDNGLHFSPPRPISEYSSSAKNYQGKLLVHQDGSAYLFWHDERDLSHSGEGNSVFFARLDQTAANRKLTDSTCECCRIAGDFTQEHEPVLFLRQVYPNQIRDHGLVWPERNGSSQTLRVTDDNWRITGCPEHGPSISIAANDVYHLAWFTQGENRQGLFYARFQNGRTNPPLFFGNPGKLPSHPSVAALDAKVALAWLEFSGNSNEIWIQASGDGGVHWQPAKLLLKTSATADSPYLIHDNNRIFLSWSDSETGHRLIKIDF
jgi:hypothetical protein